MPIPFAKWAESNGGAVACGLFNLERAWRNCKRPAQKAPRIRYDAAQQLYYSEIPEAGARCWFNNLRTANFCGRKRSVMHYLQSLHAQYGLGEVDIADGDVVIDCGANIGGIGMALSHVSGVSADYYAFEPNADVAKVCRLNNPRGTVVEKALWNEETTMQFYRTGGEESVANSSLIAPPFPHETVDMVTTTVAAFAQNRSIENIKLLKVEAEGGEPEVLAGAEPILDRVQYVTADLGPERGLKQTRTSPECINLLLTCGFRLIGPVNEYAREHFLFWNSRYA